MCGPDAFSDHFRAGENRRQGPAAGELHFTVTEFALPAHPDLILFVETPADEETRTRLPLTRRSLEPAEASA